MLTGQTPYKDNMTRIAIAQLRERPQSLSSLMPASHFQSHLNGPFRPPLKTCLQAISSMGAFRDAIEYCLKAVQSGSVVKLPL